MKKWICFMMTIILCAMTLTACGNSDRQQESVSVQEQEAAEDTEQILEAEEQEDVEELEAEVQQETEAEDSKQQETSGSAEEQAGKVLVVYYSASGNTKAVGDIIAQYTGGDVFEIIPVNAYTSEDLDWTEEGSRVNQEHENESLQDIELVSTTVDDFSSYDTIFIGYAGGIIGLNQEKPINQGFALV